MEEIVRDFQPRPLVEPEESFRHFSNQVLTRQMREILRDGTEWKDGKPTKEQKMAIFFLAGVPMRFEDHGIKGMMMVTAVQCGLTFSNGKYTVATEGNAAVGGQKVCFTP